jgi:hypothetical protein
MLQGYEKAWGAEHTLTLNTVNNFGMPYANQDKMVEAEAGGDVAAGATRVRDAVGADYPRTRLIAR